MGLEAGVRLGRLAIDFRGKVALGQMHQAADVAGVTDVLSPDEVPLLVVRKAEHSSLIEIRQNFVPEMVKTLEEY